MRVSLQGKKILITGASSGIGKATARACIAAGMQCVINARRKDKLETLADELGENCTAIDGDVTKKGFNQQLLDESGELYAIFANAGHGLNQSMVDCNMNKFRELFELNVFAAIELATLAAKQMVQRNNGHILLCASCLSKFATPQHGVYSASKSALEASVKYLARDLGEKGIRVNAISAGPIKTLAASAIGDAKFLYKWNKDHSLLKRNVDIHDVGNSALYLLSELANGVTGEIHYVDAGYNKVGMPNPKNIT